MTLRLRSFYATGNQINSEPLVCVCENFPGREVVV